MDFKKIATRFSFDAKRRRSARKFFINRRDRFVVVARRRPIQTFLLALFILLLIILLGNFITRPNTKTAIPVVTKDVQTYHIGKAPRVTVEAKIEKSGVIKIAAQTSGVVSSINVAEGQSVGKGANLISLGSDYQGDNALEVQRQLAAAGYQNILDTFSQQKDLIQKQKDLASKNAQNADQLRQISAQSIDQSQSLLNLDQDILNTLNQNEQNYVASNSAGQNNQLILQTKQLESQYQAAVNGLNQSLTQTKYQSTSSSAIPADLSNLQRDITLEQLDIQSKSLDLNKAVSGLQLQLAAINAQTMHPTAPFSGVVERIYVKVGQLVTPGTPLLELSGDSQTITAVANVPENLAKNVSELEESSLNLNNTVYNEMPAYISTESTDNGLFAVIYNIPDGYLSEVADGDYVQIAIPIGYPNTSGVLPFVPIDSVYQSQDSAYLYIVKNKKAVAKQVQLGNVYGEFVEVLSGLTSGDSVILNRNVVSGDVVHVTN